MSSNEDKLRRVLFEEAQTVLPSADAWPRIHHGVARKRQWRQWLQYGGATAGATAAIVAGLLLMTSDGPDRDRSADDPTPSVSATLGLTPTPTPTPTTEPTSTAPREPSPTPSTEATGAPSPTPAGTSGPAPGAVPPGRLGDMFAAVTGASGEMSPSRLSLLSKSDGSLVRHLTEPSKYGADPQAQVSSDGKYIYFKEAGLGCSSGLARVPASGGPIEKIVDGREAVIMFTFSGDTTIVALRRAECGGPGAAVVLVEYDATTGREIRQLEVADPPRTVLTGLSYFPLPDQLALVRSGQDGTPDRIDLYDMGTEKLVSSVTDLPPCISAGIGQVRVSADALYIGRACMNPENAQKNGHVYRVTFGGDKPVVDQIVTTPTGTLVSGLHVEPDNRVVYSTVQWMEEATPGPSILYRLEPGGQPVRMFQSADSLSDLAW